jgi:beta-glucanase (GH16 family)
MKRYQAAFSLVLLMSINTNLLKAQTLIWSDEFDYTGLPDAGKWGNEVGYIRNNELQYYTNRDIDNQVVRNGNLELIALRENFQGYAYTSASINTKGKFSLTYGRIEARMKLPMGQGLWPAFWTLGTSIDQIGWPSCGEIDVMEHINNENRTYGTAHWAGKGKRHTSSGSSYGVDPTQYHVYAVTWNSSNISWYVDNILFHQLNIEGGVNNTSELHTPQYLLLNLAVGGNWPGSPDASTVFPATVFVDYVRVYDDSPAPPPPLADRTLEAESGYCYLHDGLVRTTSGVTNWDYGRFIKYCSVFLSDQYRYVNFYFSAPGSGKLEVQLDGNNRRFPAIATLNFSAGANQVVQVPATGITNGSHDVLITGRGGNLELDKIVFTNTTLAPAMGIRKEKITTIESDPTEMNTRLFPNPARKTVHLEFVSGFEVQTRISMMDHTGRTLSEQTIKAKKGLNTMEINLSGLGRGIYLVSITTMHGREFRKMIIE